MLFFQCCREHRSYAYKQDLDTVACPHCGSVKVVKYGQTLVPHFTEDTVLVTDSHSSELLLDFSVYIMKQLDKLEFVDLVNYHLLGR